MTPSVSVGPIAIEPTVTPATSATASSARPIERDHRRAARGTDRRCRSVASSAGSCRTAIVDRSAGRRQDEVGVHREGEVAHPGRRGAAPAG